MDWFFKIKTKLGIWHFSLLFKHKWKILAVWLASLCVGAYFSYVFLQSTVIEYEPPVGTPAYIAKERLAQYFNRQATAEAAVIYVEKLSGDLPLVNAVVQSGNVNLQCSNYLEDFSLYLNQTLFSFQHKDLVDSIIGYYFVPLDVVQTAKTLSGQDPRAHFVSASNMSSIIVVNFQTTDQKFMSDEIKKVIADYDGQIACPGMYRTDVTGFEAMGNDTQSGVEADAMKMDIFAVPLALLVFWFFLRNVKMLVIPILATLTSAIYSFAAMCPIAIYAVKVTVMAPTLMVSLIIAVSTDYVLFLLTRFNEERKTKNTAMAVANMLDSTGHVVFVSGLTLSITFLSAILYPSSFLKSFGAGICIAVLSAVIVNLFLTPTLLLCFPGFFTTPVISDSVKSSILNYFFGNKKETTSQHKRAISAFKYAEHNQRNSWWFKWIKFWDTDIRSLILIIVVLGFTVPIALYAKDIHMTIDSMSVFSSDSPAVSTFLRIQSQFPAGMIAPFKILVITKSGGSVVSQSYFDLVSQINTALLHQGLINTGEMTSISQINGFQLDPEQVAELLQPGNTDPLSVSYQYYVKDILSTDQTAAMSTIFVDFDPMSTEAESWIPKVRQILDSVSQSYDSFEIHLFGGSVVIYDMVRIILEKFPIMISVTSGILLISAGFIFRSAFLPIRGIFTIGLSVCWTYGLAVLIYQKAFGMYMYWFPPVIAFSIIVGLGLDYDIFLISRIFEHRHAGFTTSASILKGLYLTGSIITGAGLIMVTAFSLLLLSHVTLISQFAMLLCSAVILDTFVIRTALVPALMRLAGWINWWPSRFGSKQAETSFGLYNEDYVLDDKDHSVHVSTERLADRLSLEFAEAVPVEEEEESKPFVQKPIGGDQFVVRKSLTEEHIHRRQAISEIIA